MRGLAEAVSLADVLVQEGSKTTPESRGAARLTLTTLESERWAPAVCADLALQTACFPFCCCCVKEQVQFLLSGLGLRRAIYGRKKEPF